MYVCRKVCMYVGRYVGMYVCIAISGPHLPGKRQVYRYDAKSPIAQDPFRPMPGLVSYLKICSSLHLRDNGYNYNLLCYLGDRNNVTMTISYSLFYFHESSWCRSDS